MEQLSALDAAFIYLESTRTPMHIGGVYLIDGKDAGAGFGYEALREHVESRLVLARTFRQRLVEVPLAMGHPYWIEDPDFDLNLHLLHVGVPRPGGKAELMRLAGEIFARPLSRARPLWEMVLVDGLDSYPGLGRGSYAIIARVHHAAVDGVSGAEIMGALVEPTPAASRELPEDRWQPERVPKGVELVAKSYGKIGSKSIDLAKTLGKTISGAGSLVSRTLEETLERPPLPMTAPRTLLNTRVGPHRTFGGVEIGLDRIKAIRQRVPGTTVNDVLLAVCAGALRDWLSNRDALPEEPLVAMVPMSVRSQDKKESMGNLVSAVLVELGTDRADPHERLVRILQSATGAKGYGRALPANELMEFVPSETAALASRLYLRMRGSERHRPFFNLVITNVPGPPVPIYLAGARVHGHLGTAPVFDGMGLILVIFSLAGRVSIGITACRDLMEEAAELEELLERSMAALEEEPSEAIDAIAARVASDRGHRPAKSEPDTLDELHEASERLAEAIGRLNKSIAAAEDD
jgi:WS/DGAT/MGAT family acyltransferase